MVNPKTRRITVRATVPNPDGRLKPEMFATITLGESELRRITVVPRDAIQTVDGKEVVFLASDGGQFKPQPVTVGSDGEDGVEIIVTPSRGVLSNAYCHPVVDQRERWRALFDLEATGSDPVDIRMFLRRADRALTV